MEINENFLLLGALETILGKGHRKSKGNVAFMCPFCNHRKPKLEINLNTDSPNFQYWECWVCGTKGRTIRSLLRHLKVNREEAQSVLQYVPKTGLEENKVEVAETTVELPKEFVALATAESNSVYANRVKKYLYARGLSDIDFVRYNIGYCMTGQYRDRVIIPSYNQNNSLNFFVARSLDPNAYAKYSQPSASKDKIIFWENLVNWTQPLILCEGVFDALAIRRNAIPILGKQISSALMKKIIENPVPDIYLVLDQDARKAAIEHCKTFLNMGKRVFFITPPKKDPSETGFRMITETLQEAEPLTFTDLVRLELSL